MKKITYVMSFFFIIGLLFIGCSNNNADEKGIFNSMEDAFSDAKKKNQNVLVIVTSNGDDELSASFVDNVINDANFKSEVSSKYTVLHMDFSEATFKKTVVNPDDDKKVQEKAEKFANLMQENAKYASKLYVQTTPAAFILTKENYFISELDLTQKIESLQDFVKMIDEQNETVTKVNQMVEACNKGNSSEKIAAIDELYEYTQMMYRSFLSDLVFEVINLDKKNESGLLSKYLLTSADITSSEYFLQGNIDAAVKGYLDICQNEYLLPEHKQQAYYLAAYIKLMTGSNDYDECLKLIDESIAAAPETDSAKSIRNMRDYLTNSIMPAE